MKPNALQYSLFNDTDPVQSEPEAPIETYRRIARERGGECLSDTYTNTITPLHFRCAHGHEWDARPHDIKRGKWCRLCGFRRVAAAASARIKARGAPRSPASYNKTARQSGEVAIQEARGIAERTGYEVVAFFSVVGEVSARDNYPSRRLAAIVRCAAGHETEKRLRDLAHGCHLCFIERRRNEKLDSMRRRVADGARKADYALITPLDTIPNYQAQVELECHRHGPDGVPHGRFLAYTRACTSGTVMCPKCITEFHSKRRKGQYKPYEQVRDELAARGWRLVSSEVEYKGRDSYLRALCPNNHEDRKKLGQYMLGTQCNQCLALKITRGEEMARVLMAQMFGVPFPKAAPRFLGRQHFDGFNDSLAIAMEYDGPYHFAEFIPKFGEPRIKDTMRRDQRKNEIAALHGIALVRIRFVEDFENHAEWFSNITAAFDGAGIGLLTETTDRLNVLAALQSSTRNEAWDRIRQIETDFHVECLDTAWRGTKPAYHWRCKGCGQAFSIVLAAFHAGRSKGCRKCGIGRKPHIHYKLLTEEGRQALVDSLAAIVADAGFALLDREWKGALANYSLRCETCNGVREYKGSSIYGWKKKTWRKEGRRGCPECRRLDHSQ